MELDVTQVSDRPEDFLFECLKRLAGIAHLDDLYLHYGQLTGRAMDEIARAKVRQTPNGRADDTTPSSPPAPA